VFVVKGEYFSSTRGCVERPKARVDLGISQLDRGIGVLHATANAVQANRVNQLLLARHLISDTKQSDQIRF
jgi:hypothetical protein